MPPNAWRLITDIPANIIRPLDNVYAPRWRTVYEYKKKNNNLWYDVAVYLFLEPLKLSSYHE